MEIKYMKTTDNWREVANAARTTIGMDEGEGEPSSGWKRKILLAEHSPIRKLKIKWKWVELPYWVSVHIVRHKIGIEHFVRSQRTDLTGIDRSEKTQSAKVEHEVEANAQAMINVSRKRLCNKAHDKTQKAWLYVVNRLQAYEPELASVCVRECVYRGFCPEMKSCGYVSKPEYTYIREAYIYAGM